MKPRSVAVVSLALLACGCSSGSSANETIPLPSSSVAATVPGTPPPLSVASSSPASTVAATTTTTVAASNATTPTNAPTTASDPATTLAPDDPRVAVEAEVRAAVERVEAGWLACRAALPNCELQALDAIYGEPQLSAQRAFAQQRNADGDHTRDLDQIRHSILSIEVLPSLEAARVTTCLEDGSVRYRIVDGNEVVVNDEFGTFVTEWIYGKASDGVWRATASEITARGNREAPACKVDV